MKNSISLPLPLFLLTLIIMLGSSSCQNQLARQYGGSEQIDLDPNYKLVTVDWDSKHNLWLLERPMSAKDTAVTCIYKEKSNMGILQGTIYITEHRK